MGKLNKLQPEFVKYIPEILEDGILYVSLEFETAIHNCCCGCGLKTVTPFCENEWKINIEGDKVSLSPSIGNWQFPCKSHYFIKNNIVEWC
jgi:hypothetical protein